MTSYTYTLLIAPCYRKLLRHVSLLRTQTLGSVYSEGDIGLLVLAVGSTGILYPFCGTTGNDRKVVFFFFPVVGEEPTYPLGKSGDLAHHLHMFLIGLRRDSFNFMVGVAIFSSPWYFCPMMWSSCLGSLLVGKDIRADTWYKCWWCHLLCGHSILVTEWLFCTANEAMSTVN